MTSSPEPKPRQHAQAGRNVAQAGNDLNMTTTTNFNFVFFLVGIVALGGIAFGLYATGYTDRIDGTVNQEQTGSEIPR